MNFSHFFTSLAAIVNEMSPYILLGFIIAGFLHVFIKPDTMGRHLAGRGIKPVIKAALLGIPLPLCSCGVLPTAVSLRRQGASKGASTSFLIATPQTGVDSIAATYSLLGLPFALLRPVGALVGALFGGMTVSKFDDESDESSTPKAEESLSECSRPLGFWRKIAEAFRYGLVDMVGSVGKWLVIGLVIAALITVLVPDELFLGLSRYPLLAMLVMVIVAVPMYICATGSIPIALSLITKGLTPGVGFVLLMAGPAANFASMMILSKTIGRKSTFIYVGSVVVTAIMFGLAIDYLLPKEWFIPSAATGLTSHCHYSFGIFESLCSLILLALLAYSGLRHHRDKINHKHELTLNTDNMKRIYIIKGMSCPHCQASVTKAISSLQGVESVSVDLGSGEAVVEGDADDSAVRDAIFNAGFSVKD